MLPSIAAVILLLSPLQDPPRTTPVTDGEHAQCVAAAVTMLHNLDGMEQEGIPVDEVAELRQMRTDSTRLLESYRSRMTGPEGQVFLQRSMDAVDSLTGMTGGQVESLIASCLPE